MKSVCVYIDFKSGPAYLAMQPTLALFERCGVTARWLPFDTRQPELPSAREGESRGETHIRVRQEQRQQTCLKYAAIRELPMAYPPSPGGTRCALAALLHVQADPLAFIAAAFTAYWRDNLDLDDPEVVAALLREVGNEAEQFSSANYEDALETNQLEAEELGVFDAPMFIVDGELFLGREQLPWIETLL